MFQADAHSLGQGQEKVAQRFGAVLDKTARSQCTAACSGQNQGQIGMGMTIPIRVAAAIEDHGMMEQRLTIDVFGVLQFLEELRELLDVPTIDFGDLL